MDLIDVNLQFWKSEGKTFLQRFLHWLDFLDPFLLVKSRKEIEASRTLLLTSQPDITESLKNKEIKEAWRLTLACVNPTTGDILPSIFRLPEQGSSNLPLNHPVKSSHSVLAKLTLIVAIAVLLPYRRVRQTFACQLFFHGYTSGFSLAHGNVKLDPNVFPQEQILLSTGTVLYSASMATSPHYIMTRYQVRSPSMQLFMKAIPGPLIAILCAFNVLAIRASELESGIEIMDSNGHTVGVSQKAGEKALQETALRRAVMIGTAVCIPDIVLHFLKRTNSFVLNPRSWVSLKHAMVISILGLMIPASFSWIPPFGTIQRSLIEPEIVSSTEETEFFYNRGL